METERIELSARERERLKVLQQVEEGHLKQVEAARRLRLIARFIGCKHGCGYRETPREDTPAVSLAHDMSAF